MPDRPPVTSLIPGVAGGRRACTYLRRHEHVRHGDRVARTPDSPLDPESPAVLAADRPGRVVAIEAVWDGDTVHDWFVILLALTADPEGEHSLATVYRETAVRHLGEEDDRGGLHPSAAAADRCGRALAARLSVPFHFAGPHTADDLARWGRGRS